MADEKTPVAEEETAANEEQAQTQAQTQKKNVYITMHRSFVKPNIPYADKTTGELKTFNSVTLPRGTKINGIDYGGYQFNPLFINDSKFRGENYVDIPLLKDRPVRLSKSVVDEDGNFVKDANGKTVKETAEVMPDQIKEAFAASRRKYLNERAQEQQKESQEKEDQGESLADRAASAKEASEVLSGDEARTPAMTR